MDPDDWQKCVRKWDVFIDKTIISTNTCDGITDTITCKIVVSRNECDDRNYLRWYIGCDRSKNEKISLMAHPFHYFDGTYDDKLSVGDIVAENEVTLATFSLISMEDEELGKRSGTTDPSYYRARLIKNIFNLWE